MRHGTPPAWVCHLVSPGFLVGLCFGLLATLSPQEACVQEFIQGRPTADQPRAAPERERGTEAAAISSKVGRLRLLPLVPGDVVSIKVLNEPTWTGEFMVDENGQLTLPRLAPIDAAGMMPSELTARLTELLSEYVIDPVVTVTLTAPVSRMVAVLGAVAKPGSYPLELCPTVLTLLATAGGPTPDANLSGVVLIRRGEQISVGSDGTPNAMPRDMALEPNDALVVPHRTAQAVFVVGAVARPGLVALPEAPYAALAVVLAGGATADADLQSAFIIRRGTRVPADLGMVMPPEPGEAAPTESTSLQPGDVIVVPTTRQRSVFVVGGVKTSGPQPYPEANRASKALAMAGGKAETADLAGAFVLRAGQKLPVNLKQVLDEGRAEADLSLEAGDALIVPEVPRKFTVAGAVLKPGSFDLTDASTVLDAVSLCGGLAPGADEWNAFLVRGGESRALNLHALIRKGDLSQNLPLEPGDTLVVPELEEVVYVMGAVGKPGPQPIEPGDRLIDILGRAGGMTAVARKVVFVYRRNTIREADARVQLISLASGRTKKELAEMAKRAAAGEPAEVIEGTDQYEARPGDVIYVPSRPMRGRTVLDALQDLLRVYLYRSIY